MPDVPPMLAGQVRRSYVMGQELIPPLVVVEFCSGAVNKRGHYPLAPLGIELGI